MYCNVYICQLPGRKMRWQGTTGKHTSLGLHGGKAHNTTLLVDGIVFTTFATFEGNFVLMCFGTFILQAKKGKHGMSVRTLWTLHLMTVELVTLLTLSLFMVYVSSSWIKYEHVFKCTLPLLCIPCSLACATTTNMYPNNKVSKPNPQADRPNITEHVKIRS